MTGKEIVQALRCCKFGAPCEKCHVVGKKDCVEAVNTAAAELIERLTAENTVLREKQRWIPVTERMPDDDATVLTYKNGILEVQKYEKGRNGWICNGWFWSMANVTHWMPLPEAPEVE